MLQTQGSFGLLCSVVAPVPWSNGEGLWLVEGICDSKELYPVLEAYNLPKRSWVHFTDEDAKAQTQNNVVPKLKAQSKIQISFSLQACWVVPSPSGLRLQALPHQGPWSSDKGFSGWWLTGDSPGSPAPISIYFWKAGSSMTFADSLHLSLDWPRLEETT